jgi:hypothetical protein
VFSTSIYGLFVKYSEFTRHLGKAGITVKEFAELLKKNPNSITNNAQKGCIPNELGVIAALIGEMSDNDIEFKRVIERLELKKRKARSPEKVGSFGTPDKIASSSNKEEIHAKTEGIGAQV